MRNVPLYLYDKRQGKNASKSETIYTDDNDWHNFTTQINTPFDDIISIEIYLYNPSEGNENIVNLYDNLRVEIPVSIGL